MNDLPTPPDSTPSTPLKLAFPTSPPSLSDPLPSSGRSGARPTHATVSTTTYERSYRNALLGLVDSLTGSVTSGLLSYSFPPLVAAARYAVLTVLASTITWGQLRLITSTGTHVFPSEEKRKALGLGETRQEESVDLRVLKDAFWIRLVLSSDLGFAEGYMAGEIEVEDLVKVLRIFVRSKNESKRRTISGVSTLPSRFLSVFTALTNSRFANTLTNSLSNIRAHYDLSNGMFSAFLSRDMTYSCAIYSTLDADIRKKPLTNGHKEDVDELEEAQLRKLRHIIRKADIRPGHRVLEIGSGWGSMAIEAVRSTNCTVDTLTLSSQQKALAEERIKEAGLAGRIRVWLMDYRSLPESWKGAFDRVISCEMLEAVGKEYIPGYFSTIDWALKEEGAACIQVITIPESRFAQCSLLRAQLIDADQQEVDFIRKWIFPGGFLPTVTYVVDSITSGSDARLVVDSVSNIGPHYARTLREWCDRFEESFDEKIVPALMDEHPEMTLDDVEVFRRKWIYYFKYCEIGFSERVIGDHIITMVREGYQGYGCQTFE